MTDSDREQGFTLVEVLIALAIVAGMTAVLAETVSQDAHARGLMRDRREALMLAQSALAGADDAASVERGAWRQYGWQVSHQPYGAVDPLDRHPLEQVTVSVSGADRRQILRLSTLRIRP